MITSNEIIHYTQAEPFRPFRIRTARGQTFDIGRPEMIRTGLDDLMIFSLDSADPRIHDDWSNVALARIESISYLDDMGDRN